MSENAREIARAVAGDKAKALRWLARAIPVRVEVDSPLLDEEAAAAFFPALDLIEIRDQNELEGSFALPWLGVLAHEGLHSTQARTAPPRAAPVEVLHQLAPEHVEPWLLVEELVAYRATYMLGELLGFDWETAHERYKAHVGAVPPAIREFAERHAKLAVDWLVENAARVQVRPFNDELSRLADAEAAPHEEAA
jgi:hypothetical protein